VATRAQVWRDAVATGEGESLEEQCISLFGISLMLLLV
jgi:hypothetical protein